MWKVIFESPSVEREVLKQIKSGRLTIEDRRVISAWIRQLELEGPESVQGDKRWSDHELHDEWEGYRSSCFSNSGRIIYFIEDEIIKVKIARITSDHDYRKPRRKK